MKRLRRWLSENDDLIALAGLFFALGGGGIVTSLVESVVRMDEPARYVFLGGVFLVTFAVCLLAAKVATARIPTSRPRRRPAPELDRLLSSLPTPAAQLSRLIEEGENLRRLIPDAAEDAKDRLVQSMLNWDLDYPARVFEWETRVWKLISSRPLNQWSALYTRTNKAHHLHGLQAHVDERVAELKTILAKA